MQAGGFLPGEAGSEIEQSAQTAPPVPSTSKQESAPSVAIPAPRAPRPLQFSLYFFGNYPAAYRDDKYDLVIEATRFADRHDFTAVWLPERHFHSVGGFSPNAAVMPPPSPAKLANPASRGQRCPAVASSRARGRGVVARR